MKKDSIITSSKAIATGVKKRILVFCLLIVTLLSTQSNAQEWEKRHAFAKAYFGAGAYYVPSLQNGLTLNYPLTQVGGVSEFSRSPFYTPTINIGATHFWGHADFYVSITTADIKSNQSEVDYDYSLGTITGLRFYPYASQEGTLRPFLGYAFSPFSYTQVSPQNNIGQFKHTKVNSIVNAGISYQMSNCYVLLEYGLNINPAFETYMSPNAHYADAFPETLLQLGVNWSIETTKPTANSVNKNANLIFSKSNKNGGFLAAGPSSAFPMRNSSGLRQFENDMSMPMIFPDFALGYHFTKSDLIIAASSRRTIQRRNAFNYISRLQRQSLNIEGYKFLFDYHGFVPYLGAGIGRENLELTRSEFGIDLDPITERRWSPNIVFGWDIRPSIKGDWWILRTNLRYYPSLELELPGGALSQQHLEFNFIQLVVYPQRLQKIMKGF